MSTVRPRGSCVRPSVEKLASAVEQLTSEVEPSPSEVKRNTSGGRLFELPRGPGRKIDLGNPTSKF
eukprot:5404648-Alexandrium_andersonii.AAC.1